MKLRSRLANFALLTILVVCASRTSAQSVDASMPVQAIDPGLTVQRDGAQIENGSLVYASIEDCGGDMPPAQGDVGSTFTFSAQYDVNVPVVEAWLGVGGIEDCSQSVNRLRPASNAALAPVCTFLGSDTSNTRSPSIEVKGSRLFSQTGWSNASDVGSATPRCDQLSGAPSYTVYLVPLPSPTTSVNASEPISGGALSTLRASFTPYTRRPDAPIHLAGLVGDEEVGVSFALPPTATTLTRYRAYFDVTDSSADSGTSSRSIACGSGLLDHHGVPPMAQSALRTSADGPSSPLGLHDVLDLPFGTQFAVAVVAIDPAGNQSFLSDPICVQRVQSLVFICDGSTSCDPKKRDSGCTVGDAAGERRGPLLLWTLLGLTLLMRRRRQLRAA